MSREEIEIAGESEGKGRPASTPAGQGNGNGTEASVFLRIVLIAAIIAAGMLGMVGLMMLKEDPAEAKTAEPVLSVEAIEVEPEAVPVTVTGLGEARALNVVPVSPEVAGNVVEIHPRLEMGEIIPAGELLFRIDPRDYRSAREQAAARVAQLEKTIEVLATQFRIDRDRLETLARNETLMRGEFARIKTLYDEDEVGTRSAVDHAEMELNQATDVRDQLAQSVDLYPARIEEAERGLDGARAQLAMAEADLARTEVRAEFDARIKRVDLERGQYVNPGTEVMTLADDQILEISLSLDSRDAKNWLQFETLGTGEGPTWFGELKPVKCRVSWTEDPDRHTWEGTLHRVENFDQNTRTVTVAVRVSADEARSSSDGLPLVDGMFCTVAIPGKMMEEVFRLPRWAVSYEGNVFVSREGRLAIQAVEPVRSEGEATFVRGLEPGATVITTRLVNPLPNTRVEIEPPEKVSS